MIIRIAHIPPGLCGKGVNDSKSNDVLKENDSNGKNSTGVELNLKNLKDLLELEYKKYYGENVIDKTRRSYEDGMDIHRLGNIRAGLYDVITFSFIYLS